MKNDQIRISDFTIYSGRNIYSHRPIMKMIVNIGKYGKIPTNEIPKFNERLLKLFPGLKTNCCSLGYEGGFLDRLNEGTYLAHVLEHVILEMQSMMGCDVRYGKTRTVKAPSQYYLVYEFENEVCGLECGKAAVVILNFLLAGKDIQIHEYLLYLKNASREAELGPSTEAIVNEAKKRGIPVTRIGNGSLVRLGYGENSRLVESTLTDTTSCISADISCNKQLTKYLLSEHKVPVPYGKVVYSEISAQMAASQIGIPVVIKPFNGNQGKGVHLNLNSNKEIRAAFRDAAQYSNGIIVEKYVNGLDYRILVVGNQVRAVSQRIPASVTGDATHTIRELVKLVNCDPNRGNKHEKPLTKLCLDDIALGLLKKKGMTPDTIVPDGEMVLLRENGNISTGGTAVDCTDIIHPENADLAVRAASAIGIDIAGIDIVTQDISKPILEHGGVIVEVNTAPGIRMHLYPSMGQPRNVAKDIVDLLFPNEDTVHFPIVSVTGTNGKTTVARLVQYVLMSGGKKVGLTSTSGTFLNHQCICRGDNSGPRSARSLLSNKSIQAAVLETARGGIIREGLGYDLADVGIITNITDDHLGIDGVETIEDLAFVKSLVVEAVKETGTAVLNAEDPSTPFILKRIKVKPILFHKNDPAPDMMQLDCVHVFTQNGWLCIKDGAKLLRVVEIDTIPITFGGIIECNIENCLAAVSALYALGISADAIRSGLLSFVDNVGRFHLFELHGAWIMLDYGHNPAGYTQVLKTCKKLEHRRLIGIIAMPGDRQDSAIRCVGKQCAAVFDRIYIKEDADLRGRAKGEVAGLFYDSIQECNFPQNNLMIAENEEAALMDALSHSAHGDLIVVFYEEHVHLHKRLQTLGAKEVTAKDTLFKAIVASDWRQTIV